MLEVMTMTAFRKSTDAPLAVGHAPVVQNLQQGVQRFWVRLFDFVK